MARPLSIPEAHRNGTNGSHHGRPASGGSHHGRPASGGPVHLHAAGVEDAPASFEGRESSGEARRDNDGPGAGLSAAEAAELEHLRTENTQLRALCLELEQALQEAAQQIHPDLEQQVREYEAVLEEKNEMIRQLHQQLQDTKAAWEEAESRVKEAAPPPPPPERQGPPPCENELLALSEELERERRQLQEDEQTLMEQMREMEVSMARERAEMARQRNDLQRLQSEIRHDLERLERNGAIQSKIESLKNKLQDVTARRGAAPAPGAAAPIAPAAPATPAAPARKEGGLMGRWFGQGK